MSDRRLGKTNCQGMDALQLPSQFQSIDPDQELIFHADPHAGNLMVQTQKHAPLTLVLLDWSQAARLSAPLRHALIALCLYGVTGDEPSLDVLTRATRE
jgi:aminoglycoside phosphotransferase (APT) family kinase protein